MTKFEKELKEKLSVAFPAGIPAGAADYLTGRDTGKTAVYEALQVIETRLHSLRNNDAERARLYDLDGHRAEEERAFAPTKERLSRSQVTATIYAKELGDWLTRELVNKRIIGEIDAEANELRARFHEADSLTDTFGPLIRLAKVRAGIEAHSERLAADFGVTVAEMMTPEERRQLDNARRQEEDRHAEDARRIEAERDDKARIYAQIEREKAQRAARESAEVELVESMTIPQMLRLLFEENQPPKDLMSICCGRFDELAQRRALQDLVDRQSWPSYTPAKIRAAARLHELVAGAKYGLELRA